MGKCLELSVTFFYIIDGCLVTLESTVFGNLDAHVHYYYYSVDWL